MKTMLYYLFVSYFDLLHVFSCSDRREKQVAALVCDSHAMLVLIWENEQRVRPNTEIIFIYINFTLLIDSGSVKIQRNNLLCHELLLILPFND